MVGKYRKRNIERARWIHYRETGKKERLDENIDTQNEMRKNKEQAMGEKKETEEMGVKRKLGPTGVVMLMVVMLMVLTF